MNAASLQRQVALAGIALLAAIVALALTSHGSNSAITSLMVVEGRRPVGLVHLHDLLRIGAA